jgi:polysaccharide export outer membrane protein
MKNFYAKLMCWMLFALTAPVAALAQTPPPAMVPPAAAGQQTQPAAAAKPAPAVKTLSKEEGEYILGPEDVIEINVLGQEEFKARGRIRADGTIVLPLIGSVNASGRSVIQFSDDIGQKLKTGGFYARPMVSVEVVSYASRYVIVLGEFAQPGLLPVDRPYRVSEIVARAGGMRPTGANHVILRRAAGGAELKLPFDQLATGDESQDPMVQPGDKLFVPAAELFYIYGQVNAPGVYPLNEELTLRKAIARGGGLTQTGSEKRVSVYQEGQQDKSPKLDRIVKAGDVIVVGERFF